MLQIVHSLGELDFPALMEIYAEGNMENGAEFYPDESPERQRMLAEEDFRDYLRRDFFTVPGAYYAIWSENGGAVSALRLEPYRDGLLLEALETAPGHRCRGYACALVKAVLAQVGAAKVYSHVGKRNAPSLRVHERCGFRRISETAAYIDGSVNSRCCTLCYDGTGETV